MHGEHGWGPGGTGFDLTGSGAEPLGEDDPVRIGPFPLVGLLGAGGMGRVYLGLAPGRFAAVKRVLPLLAEDQEFLRRFGQELGNLARLPEGVSVPLLATDRTARPPWFATEYIPGITLREALRLHGGPLPREVLWPLLAEVAKSLRATHALGMVHRDLKPSNLMLTLDGVTVIDFGVARAADQTKLTQTGMVLGTPAYMAPEQAEDVRPLTGAVDVFALGSLLVYAATGRPPFGDGSGFDLLYRIVHSTPDLAAVRAVDPEFADLLTECLAKAPADRPTAADLVERVRGRDLPATLPWPASVTRRLAERAVFAATAPAADAELDPDTVALRRETKKTEGTTATASGTPDAPPRQRKRRNRILVTVLPLVVGGGIYVATLLPYTSPSTSAQAAGSAAPSVGAAASGTASSVASPSGSRTPSGAASSGVTASASARATGGGSGQRKSGTGSGSSGSGPTQGHGTSSGGSPTGGRSPSSPGSPGGGIGSAGTYSITDTGDGNCLYQDPSSLANPPNAATSACSSASSPYYQWTFSPGSGGTFRLINKGSGDCVTAVGANAAITLEGCGTGNGQYWKLGPQASGGSTLESTAYSACITMVGDAATDFCLTDNSLATWNRY